MGLIMDNKGFNTAAGEQVKFRTGLHWAMLLGPALFMGIAGLSIPSKGINAVILLAVATIWGIFGSISLHTSEIVLTQDRIIAKTGFPWRRFYDIPYENITGISVYQPTLGKFLDFGKITFILKGGKKKSLRIVKSPLTLDKELSRYRQEVLGQEDRKE
jgi:hypothetical protein